MSDRPRPQGSKPLVSRYADDPDMAELVQLFVSELPVRIGALTAAWNEARIADLARLTHQLKGAGGGYGFPAIGDAAAALEVRLRSLSNAGDQAALQSLAREFDALVDLCARARGGGASAR